MARNYTLKGRPAVDPSRAVPLSAAFTSDDSRPAVGSGAVTSDGLPAARKRQPAGLVNCGISQQHQKPAAQGRRKDADRAFLKFIYDQAPVAGFRVLQNDVLTVRKARDPDALAERLEGSVRGEIEEFSFQSRRRLALTVSNCGIAFCSFITLTYPADFPADGKLVKRHLNAFLTALRRKLPGVAYLWFLEFQRRGAPHFHLFVSEALPEPLGEMLRSAGRVRKTVRVHWPWQDWVSEVWFRIVKSGDEKHLLAGAAWEAIESPDGAARYASKECYKVWQKAVPKAFQNVGRFWGASRNVKICDGQFIPATVDQVRALFPESVDADGNPFPVMFSAAGAYESVRGSAVDPVAIHAQKRAVFRRQREMTSGMFDVLDVRGRKRQRVSYEDEPL